MTTSLNAIHVDLDSILVVARNQEAVPSDLLNAYEGKPDQFEQLVEIIAEAQGIAIASNDTIFTKFVKDGEANWVKWALVAKAFRKWLSSTHYTYESTTPERLAELFLEHLESNEAG